MQELTTAQNEKYFHDSSFDEENRDSAAEPALSMAGQFNKARQQQKDKQLSKNNIKNKVGKSNSVDPLLSRKSHKKSKDSDEKTDKGRMNSKQATAKSEKKQGRLQKLNSARKKIAKNGGIKGTAQKMSQEATKSLLRQAWLAVPSTFGFSLIYVWFHYIARYTANSKFFSDFGSVMPKVKGVNKKKKSISTLEFTEKRAAEISFLGVNMFVFGMLAIVGFMIYTILNPWVLVKIGWEALKRWLGL